MDDRVSTTTEMSFVSPEAHLSGLDAHDLSRVLGNASDIVLIVNTDGRIMDAAFGDSNLFEAGAKGWVGHFFRDVVMEDSRPKVEAMFADHASGEPPRVRELNHRLADGSEIPVRYGAVALGNQRLIVFGRDISRISALQQRLMSSQLSIEREFAKLRSAEGRYRTIFQLVSTPLMVVDATSLRITDINASGRRLLGLGNDRHEGSKVLQVFDTDERDVLHKMMLAAIEGTTSEPIVMRLRSGDEIRISFSMFREERRNHLLLHLDGEVAASDHEALPMRRALLRMVETMPDAVVVTDQERRLLTANEAFVDLFSLNNIEDARERPLDIWFDRPNVDCSVLMANLREHGLVRRFATLMRGAYGQQLAVEIAASAIEGDNEHLFGFVIRPTSQTPIVAEDDDSGAIRSDEQITNLVGHMPLKDIVRETTEMIEKLCIDTALEITRGNRASAAQMLGLSRQSLYAKLERAREDDDG